MVLASDAAKAKPGLKGNLIVNVYATRTPPGGNKADKAPAPARRVLLDTLPAIPFEVVQP